jgi:hypothetical protein
VCGVQVCRTKRDLPSLFNQGFNGGSYSLFDDKLTASSYDLTELECGVGKSQQHAFVVETHPLIIISGDVKNYKTDYWVNITSGDVKTTRYYWSNTTSGDVTTTRYYWSNTTSR